MGHSIKKTYARIMAKGGELADLKGELQVTYNPASRSGFFRPNGRGGKEKNWGYQVT